MIRQEEVKAWLKDHEGHEGVIPVRYFWIQSEDKWGPIMIDWEEVPKENHGQVLRNLHDGDLGKPAAVYVVMEVRSLPMNLDGEEQSKLQEELKKYKMETGSFEGFPGIKDYAMYIGYDGTEYNTEMFELEIDANDVRKFGDSISLGSVMSGTYAENLNQAFHNTGPEVIDA